MVRKPKRGEYKTVLEWAQALEHYVTCVAKELAAWEAAFPKHAYNIALDRIARVEGNNLKLE